MRESIYKIRNTIFVFIFIFSFFLTSAFAEKLPYRIIKDIGSEEGVGQKAVSKAGNKEVVIRPKVEYMPAGSRDPFQSPIRMQNDQAGVTAPESIDQQNPIKSLKVQGVIWGGELPQAIINNKVLKIGDTIESFRIVGIDRDGVTVISGSYQYILPSSAGEIIEKKLKEGKNEKKF